MLGLGLGVTKGKIQSSINSFPGIKLYLNPKRDLANISDENVNDYSGYGHTGVMKNNMVLNQTPGLSYYTFDGVDDYIDFGSVPELQFKDEFTIVILFKTLNEDITLFGVYDYGADKRSYYFILSGGKLEYFESSDGINFARYRVNINFNDNNSHLIAIRKIQTELKIWEESTPLTVDLLSGTPVSVLYSPDVPFLVGARLNNDIPNQFFKGRLGLLACSDTSVPFQNLEKFINSQEIQNIKIGMEKFSLNEIPGLKLLSLANRDLAGGIDEFVNDYSGFGNIGIMHGEMVSDQIQGTSFYNFNGINSYVDYGVCPDLQFTDQFTISFIFESLVNEGTICGIYDYGADKRSYYFILSSGRLEYWESADGINYARYRIKQLKNVADGKPHIFIVRKNGVNLDAWEGESQTTVDLLSGTPVPTLYQSDAPFLVGARQNNDNQNLYFNGQIGGVIASNIALSDISSIATSYEIEKIIEGM